MLTSLTQKNEWMNARTNEWMHERMNEWWWMNALDQPDTKLQTMLCFSLATLGFFCHYVKRHYGGGGGGRQEWGLAGSPQPQITGCSPGTRVRKSAWSECQLVGHVGTLSGSVCHLLPPHWNLAIIWWKHFAYFQENFPLSVRLFFILRLSPKAFRTAVLLSPWEACVSEG